MTHSYNITGMSCDGCRFAVEKVLNTIQGIKASVTLDPPVATIEMDETIPTTQLQKALKLAGNYTIEPGNLIGITSKIDESHKEKSCCCSTKKQ